MTMLEIKSGRKRHVFEVSKAEFMNMNMADIDCSSIYRRDKESLALPQKLRVEVFGNGDLLAMTGKKPAIVKIGVYDEYCFGIRGYVNSVAFCTVGERYWFELMIVIVRPLRSRHKWRWR
jgi:hypothetical protein